MISSYNIIILLYEYNKCTFELFSNNKIGFLWNINLLFTHAQFVTQFTLVWNVWPELKIPSGDNI